MPLSETEHITFATLRSENIKLFQNFPLCEGAITLVNRKMPSAAVISFFTLSWKLFKWQAHMPWEIIACIHISITSDMPALSSSFLHFIFSFWNWKLTHHTTAEMLQWNVVSSSLLPSTLFFFFFKPKVCRMLTVNKACCPLGNSA